MISPDSPTLSTHRQAMMGIAISLIMLCHLQLRPTVQWVSQFCSDIQILSQIGVDIFLLCSGYGLYFSYTRTKHYGRFVSKRLLRILPAYGIMMAVWALFARHYGESVSDFLHQYFLLSFFTEGELIVWYVPAILSLYLLFPMAIPATRTPKTTLLCCMGILVCSFGIAVTSVCPPNIRTMNEVFFVRIPVFLAGVCWARHGSPLPKFLRAVPVGAFLTAAVLLVGCALINVRWLEGISWWWANRMLFCPLTLCLLSLLLPVLTRGKNTLWYRCFSFLGGITLELYLIHEILMIYLLAYILFRYDSPFQTFCISILSVFLSIPLAWCLHKLCSLATPKAAAKQSSTNIH
ncbi:MAG TPA: acyltransferase [Candidatus Faecousia intestinavium]|nr:acyltransferase [Candidatus Faecousia intestinavium]